MDAHEDDALLPLRDQMTGKVRGFVVRSTSSHVAEAVQAAVEAKSGPWGNTSMEQRAALLHRCADVMEQELEAFALAESRDTGKPLNLARNMDVARAIANFRFFAGYLLHGAQDLRHQGGGDMFGSPVNRSGVPTLTALNYSMRKPVDGVVGLITPWNLPLYLLTWKLAPALAVGNVVVAKPSELTPSTALLLAKLLCDPRVGLPSGVFNVVQGEGGVVGKSLCMNKHVSAMSFTGGTKTGAEVAREVAPRFAKLSLEMGGKNPLIVFADVESGGEEYLNNVVDGAVRASFLNSGQVCLCPERILVERTVDGFHERFRDKFVARTMQLVVGDPTEATTDLGPLISQAQFEKVKRCIDMAKEEGGKVLTGGAYRPSSTSLELLEELSEENPMDGGYWMRPVVVDYGLTHSSRVVTEEVFGPFVTLHQFEGEDEAVRLANCTDYGLAASVWSTNLSRAHSVAARIDAGTVWVNCWLHRELHMPFGGMKHSGVSREGGANSLDFYSETSTVSVKLGDLTPPPMPGAAAQKQQQHQQPQHAPHQPQPRPWSPSYPVEPQHSPMFARRSFSSFEGNANPEGIMEGMPSPMGAYPHARRVGNLLYLSGIGPRSGRDNSVPGGTIDHPITGERQEYDVEKQTRQCIRNVELVLKAHDLTLKDCVDVHCFLVDMKRDFQTFNDVYAQHFHFPDGTPSPVRTTVQVNELPPGGRIAVELKVVAAFPEGK